MVGIRDQGESWGPAVLQALASSFRLEISYWALRREVFRRATEV